jgi:hypothetical protein
MDCSIPESDRKHNSIDRFDGAQLSIISFSFQMHDVGLNTKGKLTVKAAIIVIVYLLIYN